MVLARQMVTKPGKTDKDKRTPISLPALARVFGHRDHTTVICAMRSIPKLSENDSELAAKIKQIRDSLEAA
jgi:chromosomal replication initiation ATPase DnaA